MGLSQSASRARAEKRHGPWGSWTPRLFHPLLREFLPLPFAVQPFPRSGTTVAHRITGAGDDELERRPPPQSAYQTQPVSPTCPFRQQPEAHIPAPLSREAGPREFLLCLFQRPRSLLLPSPGGITRFLGSTAPDVPRHPPKSLYPGQDQPHRQVTRAAARVPCSEDPSLGLTHCPCCLEIPNPLWTRDLTYFHYALGLANYVVGPDLQHSTPAIHTRLPQRPASTWPNETRPSLTHSLVC